MAKCDYNIVPMFWCLHVNEIYNDLMLLICIEVLPW